MNEITIDSPYVNAPNSFWMRGNLHTHTTRSDGSAGPQEMIDLYARLGSDFLMLSDHDILGDFDGLDARGMVLLRGTEVCGGGPHMLDVGARKLVNAQNNQQAAIDEINRDSGFVILCHPNWEDDFDHYPMAQLLALRDYAGIEIFNGVVIDLAGNHLATDKWDRLLAAGRKVWGFANDDAHRPAQAGRGWNVVRLTQRTPEAIVASLRSGNFYASSGVQIEEIRCDGPVLTLMAPNADRIAVFGLAGARIHLCDGPEMAFDVSNIEGPLIRVECYGRGGDAAWTAPMYIRNGQHEIIQRKIAQLGSLPKATLHAAHCQAAPKMTGSIDDPQWSAAEAFDRFVTIREADQPPVKTEVRAIVAANTLYLAAKCEEPRLEDMKLTIEKNGQMGLWTNDGLEFCIDVEGRGASFYHVLINANGVAAAVLRGQGKTPSPQVVGKSARWQEGGRRGWSIELAIGLEQLGGELTPGTRYGFHVCRNRFAVAGSYVWSWVNGSNHAAALYGSLIL